MTNSPHPRRRTPARNRFFRFFRRHREGEEIVGAAVGLNIIWQLLVGAGVFAAGFAAAATLSTSPAARPNANLSLSIKGAALLTRHEGVRYTPYNDPYNCTYGVGSLIHYGVCTPYDYAHYKLTPASAIALLMRNAGSAESCVRALSKPLNQPQFDALVDLTFNAGCGSLDYSGIRNEINAGNFVFVPSTLERTAVTANGVYLRGLATRRVDEAVLFRTGYYGAGLGYYTPPKPPTAADLLRAKTGYWSWLAWYLGAKPWHKYGPRNPRVRPHVPAKVPAAWWIRERAFVRARR